MVQHQHHDSYFLGENNLIPPTRSRQRIGDEAEMFKAHRKNSTITSDSEDETATSLSSSQFEDEHHDGTSSRSSCRLGQDVEACTTVEIPDRKHVSFSNVQVRTYELIVGDNPDCSFPLSLGWRYQEEDTLDVDSFEQQRHERQEDAIGNTYTNLQQPQHQPPGPSKCLPKFPLTLHQRRLRLRSLGHTEVDLRRAERKRRIELALQWAGGQFPKEEDFPYSKKYYLNYVLWWQTNKSFEGAPAFWVDSRSCIHSYTFVFLRFQSLHVETYLGRQQCMQRCCLCILNYTKTLFLFVNDAVVSMYAFT